MRCAVVALALALLPSLAAGAVATNDEGCSFSWGSLGCTPSKECKLKFAPRFGTFGPCVRREAKAEAAPPAAESAAAAEPAATEPTAAEPAAAEEAVVEEVEEAPAKDEP